MLKSVNLHGQPLSSLDFRRRTKVVECRSLRDRLRSPLPRQRLQRCQAKQQQEESAETSRQVAGAAETAGKVRNFLDSDGQQQSGEHKDTSLPSAEDVVRPLSPAARQVCTPRRQTCELFPVSAARPRTAGWRVALDSGGCWPGSCNRPCTRLDNCGHRICHLNC